MININTIPTKILIEGAVNIKVYDALDLERMEPKVSSVDQNDIDTPLLNEMITAMKSSSGSTSFQLNTGTNWFSDRYPGNNPNDAVTSRHGEDGILSVSSITTGVVDEYQGSGTEAIKHFFLYQTKSTSNTTNETEWEAESTWSLATTTISMFELGKDYFANSQSPTATFNDPFATYNVSNFTMLATDILRVTWTITVG